MSEQFGYLTPSSLPADTICRVLLIPNDEGFIAVVTGALNSLVLPENWTLFGTLTPEQSAAALVEMFDKYCFSQGVCRVIGEIISWAAPSSPDPKWLICDGRSLARVDYPDLFTVIGALYGYADASHFNIPDLRGRVPLGMGAGTGLSTYNAGDNGGEEAHTLSTAEAPSHSHLDAGHSHTEGTTLPSVGAAITGVPVPSAVPSVGVTGIGSANIGNAGGGSSHNNLQPYLAINYLIVAQT